MATTKKTSHKSPKPKAGASKVSPAFLSREERLAKGKALRDTVPRTSHAEWKPPPKHRDPIAILEKSNIDRLQELVPAPLWSHATQPLHIPTRLGGADGL